MLLATPLLVLILTVAYLGYLSWRTPWLVGRWELRDDPGWHQAFNRDGSGLTTEANTGAKYPFHWKARGARLEIAYEKAKVPPRHSPPLISVGDQRGYFATWSVSEPDHVLTIYPSNGSSYVYMAEKRHE